MVFSVFRIRRYVYSGFSLSLAVYSMLFFFYAFNPDSLFSKSSRAKVYFPQSLCEKFKSFVYKKKRVFTTLWFSVKEKNKSKSCIRYEVVSEIRFEIIPNWHGSRTGLKSWLKYHQFLFYRDLQSHSCSTFKAKDLCQSLSHHNLRSVFIRLRLKFYLTLFVNDK